mgnify:FL=1
MNTIKEYNPFKLVKKENRGNKKLIFIAIVTIILGILIGIFVYKYLKKPTKYVYLKEPKNAKLFTNIKIDPSINQGDTYDFCLSFWYLLGDWKFKNGKSKHILSKGMVRNEAFHKNSNQKWLNVCPAVFFDKKNNNMNIYIRTKRKIETIIIEDMPIHQWTHVAINNNERTTEIYINGMLRKTVALSDTPMVNNKTIKLNANKKTLINFTRLALTFNLK